MSRDSTVELKRRRLKSNKWLEISIRSVAKKLLDEKLSYILKVAPDKVEEAKAAEAQLEHTEKVRGTQEEIEKLKTATEDTLDKASRADAAEYAVEGELGRCQLRKLSIKFWRKPGHALNDRDNKT
ncbi:hypothetical protein Bca4012_073044 [Brassica carinata]|uniref:Uncharacterized protein n=1 Tax=Brassica carinata TaxID=52824 RepID=A0A8X7QLR3_BRACI|nr:hypothetical protein Bca52824_065390 [Brassica carinata]